MYYKCKLILDIVLIVLIVLIVFMCVFLFKRIKLIRN